MQNHSTDQSSTGATQGKALLLLLLCVVLSVLANVYVANTDVIGRIAHAWPPIALALTAHVVWVVRGRSRWVTAITVALLILVAAVAGAISYVGLQALATAANMSPLAAAWFPLTVDGLGLAAGIAFAAGHPSQPIPATLPATDTAEQIVATQNELDDQAAATDPRHALPAAAATELETIPQVETASLEEDSHEAEDDDVWAEANPAPSGEPVPDPDRQVELVMDMLRADPNLTAAEIQLYVPGVSSLRTAQRRLQSARQALQNEAVTQRDLQLVAAS